LSATALENSYIESESPLIKDSPLAAETSDAVLDLAAAYDRASSIIFLSCAFLASCSIEESISDISPEPLKVLIA